MANSPPAHGTDVVGTDVDRPHSIVDQHCDGTLARGHIRRNHIGRAICMLMCDRLEWQGTAAQLLDELKRLHPNDRRLAGQTPGGLGQHLSKLHPKLMQAGCVEVEMARVGHNRTRMIFLTRLDQKACADAAIALRNAGSADEADSVCAESTDVKRALGFGLRPAHGLRNRFGRHFNSTAWANVEIDECFGERKHGTALSSVGR
ncbi:hypothetical protein [Terricaulis silvestris]|uniref:hypothetical protein n=1 Tax=Terricaulis silvestris TaxID=2686094 RepID=UPI00131D962A|nr:hypothetical protein [Terricaulis silvestris]